MAALQLVPVPTQENRCQYHVKQEKHIDDARYVRLVNACLNIYEGSMYCAHLVEKIWGKLSSTSWVLIQPLLSRRGIEAVLHSVFCSPWKQLCDFAPPVAHVSLKREWRKDNRTRHHF